MPPRMLYWTHIRSKEVRKHFPGYTIAELKSELDMHSNYGMDRKNYLPMEADRFLSLTEKPIKFTFYRFSIFNLHETRVYLTLFFHTILFDIDYSLKKNL
jgi:hypothetical protein